MSSKPTAGSNCFKFQELLKSDYKGLLEESDTSNNTKFSTTTKKSKPFFLLFTMDRYEKFNIYLEISLMPLPSIASQ